MGTWRYETVSASSSQYEARPATDAGPLQPPMTGSIRLAPRRKPCFKGAARRVSGRDSKKKRWCPRATWNGQKRPHHATVAEEHTSFARGHHVPPVYCACQCGAARHCAAGLAPAWLQAQNTEYRAGTDLFLLYAVFPPWRSPSRRCLVGCAFCECNSHTHTSSTCHYKYTHSNITCTYDKGAPWFNGVWLHGCRLVSFSTTESQHHPRAPCHRREYPCPNGTVEPGTGPDPPLGLLSRCEPILPWPRSSFAR